MIQFHISLAVTSRLSGGRVSCAETGAALQPESPAMLNLNECVEEGKLHNWLGDD